MEQYQKAARLLDRIERELNSLGLWQSHQPPVQALEKSTAFCGRHSGISSVAAIYYDTENVVINRRATAAP